MATAHSYHGLDDCKHTEKLSKEVETCFPNLIAQHRGNCMCCNPQRISLWRLSVCVACSRFPQCCCCPDAHRACAFSPFMLCNTTSSLFLLPLICKGSSVALSLLQVTAAHTAAAPPRTRASLTTSAVAGPDRPSVPPRSSWQMAPQSIQHCPVGAA